MFDCIAKISTKRETANRRFPRISLHFFLTKQNNLNLVIFGWDGHICFVRRQALVVHKIRLWSTSSRLHISDSVVFNHQELGCFFNPENTKVQQRSHFEGNSPMTDEHSSYHDRFLCQNVNMWDETMQFAHIFSRKMSPPGVIIETYDAICKHHGNMITTFDVTEK